MHINSWLNTIAPAGSDDYYGLRNIDSEKQNAIKLILALFDTIFNIPLTLSDDNLVNIKLRWWKEEMIKTERKEASHPLCIALSPIMAKYHLSYNALLQFISAIEGIVHHCQFPTEQSLRDFYTYTYGIRERMIAKILCPNASQYSDAIHHLAYSLALIDNLKHIYRRAKKMYLFFSDEETRELGIDKNIVLTMRISDSLKKLFEKQIEQASKHWKSAINIVRSNKISCQPRRTSHPQDINNTKVKASFGWHDALRPLFLRTQLGLKWCDLIRDENFPLFTHQVDIAPLRKWWHTLRISV